VVDAIDDCLLLRGWERDETVPWPETDEDYLQEDLQTSWYFRPPTLFSGITPAVPAHVPFFPSEPFVSFDNVATTVSVFSAGATEGCSQHLANVADFTYGGEEAVPQGFMGAVAATEQHARAINVSDYILCHFVGNCAINAYKRSYSGDADLYARTHGLDSD